MDDSEAPDGKDLEMGRRGSSQIERSTRVIIGFGAAWGYSRWRITGGAEGWRDSLAGGGVALRRDAC